MREREDANRTREAGHLDEIQGVVASSLELSSNGAVGFIDWLDEVAGYLANAARPVGDLQSVDLMLAFDFQRSVVCPCA